MKKNTTIKPVLMKTSELAAHVGVSVQTIYDWQANTAHKIPKPVLVNGKHVYYNRAAAEDWIAKIARGEVA